MTEKREKIKVDGDHPIFKRALKSFWSMKLAKEYRRELRRYDYQNVTIKRG